MSLTIEAVQRKASDIKVCIESWGLVMLQRSEGLRAGLVVHGEEVCLQVPQKAAEVRGLSSGIHRSPGYVVT